VAIKGTKNRGLKRETMLREEYPWQESAYERLGKSARGSKSNNREK